ncbi:SDR family oxidoreductase [Alcanivorax sediminis]|uniref:NAD-dependent epimerase/dehydratase family protein n=1 Tax=Alcanivorax sediminis TaxID=2663008 RepID=A0A6N7LSH2_9GAMM|nr:SDR family oxidoreductase [Alcanivorax sediminis]MQX52114.1 NAD-dependent epimerase/dehydratase family protein [Alcanivorax sediminis]
MTILITGASGFIGSHVCAQLTREQLPVLAMLRQPQQQLAVLRQQVDALGGQGSLVQALQGDLDQAELGLNAPLPELQAIIHLGARFAWQLPMKEARRTNVDGALAVARLALRQQARLVFISGFMLENHEHLTRLGIDLVDSSQTQWQQVYRRAGGYEASKLEAAIRVREFACEQGLDLVEVQPATVAGHSHSGQLDSQQPLYQLIDNLANGRMAAIPGTPDHWLPLVAVDLLAALIARAAVAEDVPSRLLALDTNTPSLQGLLGKAAEGLGQRPPRRFLPMAVLATLLRIPGLPRLLNTWPEALHFIQTTRFDTSVTEDFLAGQGLAHPGILPVIAASTRHYRQQQQGQGTQQPA